MPTRKGCPDESYQLDCSTQAGTRSVETRISGKNTREIVKRGTALYEKLASFTETFERIGETLKTASAAYDTALGQLSAGKGNVIRQAEMLKELGITPKRNYLHA